MFLFCISFALTLYVYVGYPLLLASGLLGRRKPVRKASFLPTVSLIVPAYNEEKNIENKLQNLLSLDYPTEKMEILVGDDGSTDQTAAVVKRYQNQGVTLVSVPEQIGKSAIQNRTAARAKGSILVFTDADSLLPQNALLIMMANFADAAVGLVTNHCLYLNPDENGVTKSETLYWRYEHWLQQQESDRALLAMASGPLFAVRRKLWKPLDPNVGDDFVLPLQVVQAGARNILEPLVAATMRLTQNRIHSMLGMKKRIISKDLRGLLKNYHCLNPLKCGAVAITLWSHKLLRWFVPYYLLILFSSNVLLASQRPFSIVLGLQVLFYGSALAGVALGRHRLRFPFAAVSSFCLVNFAALLGTLHCMARRPAGRWKTVR